MLSPRRSMIAAALALLLVAACSVDPDPDGLVTDVVYRDVGIMDVGLRDAGGGGEEDTGGEPDTLGLTDSGHLQDLKDAAELDTTPLDTGGEVAAPCECDCDDLLCTSDECDPDCTVCSDEPFDDFEQEALGLLPPLFTLEDVNPSSDSFGTLFALSEFAGATVVLLFHASNCADCLFQGQSARGVWDELAQDEGIWMATVNARGAEPFVNDYVNVFATQDDVGYPLPAYPAPSTWPVLQDTAEEDATRRFCADNNYVFIIGGDGRVHGVFELVNFKDAFARQSFVVEVRAIAASTNP